MQGIIPAIVGALALAQSGGIETPPQETQTAQLERLKAELAEIRESDRRVHEAQYCAKLPAACYFDGARLRPVPDPAADFTDSPRRGVDWFPAHFAGKQESDAQQRKTP